LPEEDRPGLSEAISDLTAAISTSSPEQEFKFAFQAGQDLLVPWIWTAEEWAFNPSVHRLSAGLGGDGPEIEATTATIKKSEGGSQAPPWLVRALDSYALKAWEALAAKLPEATAEILGALRSDPTRSSLLQKALCGQLGRVTINGQALEQWQIRGRGGRRRGKRTMKDTGRTISVRLGSGQVAVAFEARVVYAVDPRSNTVWVTDAHLCKQDLKSREWTPVEDPSI
jgi:hypothetical protein